MLKYMILERTAGQVEFFKKFSDNQSFRKWLADMIIAMTDAANS